MTESVAVLRKKIQKSIEERDNKLIGPVLDNLVSLKSPNKELVKGRAVLAQLQNENTLLQARVVALNQIQELEVWQQRLAIGATDPIKNDENRKLLDEKFQEVETRIEELKKGKINGVPIFPDKIKNEAPSDVVNTDPAGAKRNDPALDEYIEEHVMPKHLSRKTPEYIEKSPYAPTVAEQREPILTPVNNGNEQFTMVDKEGFVHFARSMKEGDRILYEVDNSYLYSGKDQVPADLKMPNEAVSSSTYRAPLPIEEQPKTLPVPQKAVPENERPVEQRENSNSDNLTAEEFNKILETFPAELPVELPVLNLLTTEEALHTQEVVTNRFEETVTLYEEALESYNQNREDLESVIRAVSSRMNITNPEEHVPLFSTYGYNNLLASQSNLISANTLALLKAEGSI
jgi:hypothetical protein